MRKFTGIDFLTGSVPDETTLCNFRYLLEEHELNKLFFDAINQVMEASGHIMKGGTIVDATIIDAPSSTRNAEKKRDPEMHPAKKGNQWRFGMKCHAGVDAGTGYVHTIEVTSANVHIIKCQFGYRKVQYRGLKKNEDRLYAMFACANFYVLAMAGRKLQET